MPWVITPVEASELLGVHLQTVYEWLRSGEIPGRKVKGKWLISKASLIAFLQHHPRPPLAEINDRSR